ncbi:MAG: hypothetical protein ABIP89_03460 [Polyangiaceae bacterium]
MTLFCAGEARADEATVSVGDASLLEGRYAEPPPDAPVVRTEPTYYDRSPYIADPPREVYRSPFRLSLGPAGVTSGRGLGLGLGLAADFGTGTVGARIAAAWMRGEEHDDLRAFDAPLGNGLAQYTGELTLDFHKRGPVHPVFGMGFGLAHVSKPSGSGNAGIGTVRLGIEYALGLEDADVRIGGGVTGVLSGPSEREVENLRGYAVIGGTLAIGF